MPERLRGQILQFDVTDKAGKVIVAKDKRITVKHIREMAEAGLPFILDPGQNIVLFSGEQLLEMIDRAPVLVCNDYEAELIDAYNHYYHYNHYYNYHIAAS